MTLQTISKYVVLMVTLLLMLISFSASAQTNLVPNGDFSAGSTGWEIPSSASTAGGNLVMQPPYTSSSYRAVSSTIPVNYGNSYRFSFYYNAGTTRFRMTLVNASLVSNCDGSTCQRSFSLNIPQPAPASWNTSSGYVNLTIYFPSSGFTLGGINTFIIFEPLELDGTFVIDNVSLTCLYCAPTTPDPSLTPPPSYTPPPGYVTTTPRPSNPNPPPGCLLECGAIPLPLPNMPGLLSPTPNSGGTGSNGTATPYSPGDSNATPIIDGLGSEIHDLEGIATATGVGPQAPGGDDIGIGTTFDLVDDTGLWIAYAKGLWETDPFGPFAPLVALFLVVLLVAIAYLAFSFVMPLAAAFVGLTRKLYTAIMDALPL